jgi:predicted membrane metal-binding protein
MSAHEDLNRHIDVKGGSDRSFGLTFAAIFAVLGLWPRLHHQPIRAFWLIASIAVMAIALIKSPWLGPLNRIWTKFGGLLNRIVSPLVSALVFYAAVTPIALVMRWRGKDPLRLRIDPHVDSYWLLRVPPGPDPSTMNHQF